MSTEPDFTKPLEYVSPDGAVCPFTLLTTNGRGDYPVMGYIGDSTRLTTFMLDGRLLPEDTIKRLRNVKRKPREWYTWARDAGPPENIDFTGDRRFVSSEEARKVCPPRGANYIVRVTEVLSEEE